MNSSPSRHLQQGHFQSATFHHDWIRIPSLFGEKSRKGLIFIVIPETLNQSSFYFQGYTHQATNDITIFSEGKSSLTLIPHASFTVFLNTIKLCFEQGFPNKN